MSARLYFLFLIATAVAACGRAESHTSTRFVNLRRDTMVTNADIHIVGRSDGYYDPE